MCEQCEARRAENTQIKRAAVDAFNAQASIDVDAIPGYRTMLVLSGRLERICRSEPIDGKPDPEDVALFRSAVRTLTWQERSAALKVITWMAEHLTGLQQNLAGAKKELRDPDVVLVELRFTDGAIEVVKNGLVVERITLGVDEPPEQALDAAERAMAAHREQMQHPTDG